MSGRQDSGLLLVDALESRQISQQSTQQGQPCLQSPVPRPPARPELKAPLNPWPAVKCAVAAFAICAVAPFAACGAMGWRRAISKGLATALRSCSNLEKMAAEGPMTQETLDKSTGGGQKKQSPGNEPFYPLSWIFLTPLMGRGGRPRFHLSLPQGKNGTNEIPVHPFVWSATVQPIDGIQHTPLTLPQTKHQIQHPANV